MKLPHENLPSNKHFGVFFLVILFAVTIYAFCKAKITLLIISSLIAIVIAIFLIFKPDYLNPFNRAWMYFGFLLGRIVSPIVLGILYFFLITPLALIMRIFGRDELELHAVKLNSSWRAREKSQAQDSFKNQF